jgi:hypothetical protein
MSLRNWLACLLSAVLWTVASPASLRAAVPPTAEHPWRALHVINYTTDDGLKKLTEQLPQLAKMGINCLILEVNYGGAAADKIP